MDTDVWEEGQDKWTWRDGEAAPRFVHSQISRTTILEQLNKAVTQQAEIDELASATIDFIDQMRVQGCEGYTLPAEYDTLVDVVNKYRGMI